MIIINVLPILAEQAIIAHTLLPVPHKGSKPIRAKGGTNTILVSFEFNLPHTSCCLSLWSYRKPEPPNIPHGIPLIRTNHDKE